MDDIAFGRLSYRQRTGAENAHHAPVVIKYIRLKPSKPPFARNADDAPHQHAGDAKTLVVLHDSESDFGAAFGRLRRHGKIAGAANDDLVIALRES